MFKEPETSEITVGELLRKKEELGLRFFKNCIQRTNQFSTKYVLQKVLRAHQDHVEELNQELQKLSEEMADDNLVSEIEKVVSAKDLSDEFDLATLTFREATRLAMRFAENDIIFYEKLLKKIPDSSSAKSIERVLYKKSTYVLKLKSEYERLRHK